MWVTLVAYQPFYPAAPRVVRVTAVFDDIKKGRPGFDAIDPLSGDEVWG